MTLARRLLRTNLALISGVIVLAGVALWGVATMRQDVHSLMEEHEELQRIDSASVLVAETVGILRVGNVDEEQVTPRIAKAREALLGLFEEQVDEDVDLDPDHGVREDVMMRGALATLDDLLAALRQHDGNRARLLELASQALEKLGELVDETHLAAKTARRDTSAATRRTAVTIVLFALGAVMAAVALSVVQHRSVMRPLNRLRTAVYDVSRRRFDQRVKASGDQEFQDLADDFNRMADELSDLYENLENQVRTKSRELVRSERLASVGYLAAGVAHEINNPLGIISTYAELSLIELDGSNTPAVIDETKRSLRIMHEEAHRCKSIIQKLLELSKRGDSVRNTVCVAKEVRDVLAIVSKLKEYATCQFNVSVDDDASTRVLANQIEIRQLLLNLIINATEATRPPDGRVDIRVVQVNGNVEITVRDNGCGMDHNTISQVFEPFFSKRRGAAGHGLGLSICHAIVESHEGKIIALSDGLGRGSVFTVRLPPLEPVTSGRDAFQTITHG